MAESRVKVVAAFASIYLIWGSTFLAIRFAIETIPPLLMIGVRFLVAGMVLYIWVRARGAERPTRAHWISATIVGALLLLCGNGAVAWAEQHVPSGIAALLVATMPLWMVLLDWLRPGGTRPSATMITGVALGLAGLALLLDPGARGGGVGGAGGQAVDAVGAATLVAGSLAWAAGSLYSARARLPSTPLLATAMQMLAGGVLCLILGALMGEATAFDVHAVSPRSALALLYLIVFGSLIGFTSYIWLLRAVHPARVSTYAYVNPVVAVILGWALADEPLSSRTVVAAGIIIGAVALITVGRSAMGRGKGQKNGADGSPERAGVVGARERASAAG